METEAHRQIKMMTIEFRDKKFAPAYMGIKLCIDEIFFRRHGEVSINGTPTGFTTDELGWDNWAKSTCSGNNIARKRRWAKIRQAVAAECGLQDYAAQGLMARTKIATASRILAKCGRIPYPNEDGSLYQRDANKWTLVSKECKAVQSLIALGYAYAVPEGTFFGNSPKEYDNILVQIDEAAIWRSVK